MADGMKCPFCGTEATRNANTRRTACKCRRMHEYIDINGKKYWVLYKKDGTKEIMRNENT